MTEGGLVGDLVDVEVVEEAERGEEWRRIGRVGVRRREEWLVISPILPSPPFFFYLLPGGPCQRSHHKAQQVPPHRHQALPFQPRSRRRPSATTFHMPARFAVRRHPSATTLHMPSLFAVCRRPHTNTAQISSSFVAGADPDLVDVLIGVASGGEEWGGGEVGEGGRGAGEVVVLL